MQLSKESGEKHSNKNLISEILLNTGWIIIVIGVVAGFIVADSIEGSSDSSSDLYYSLQPGPVGWWYGIITAASGFISGMFFIGMSEIISLLEKIYNKPIITNSNFSKEVYNNDPIEALKDHNNVLEQEKRYTIKGRAFGNYPDLNDTSATSVTLHITNKNISVIGLEGKLFEVLISNLEESSTIESKTGDKYLLLKYIFDNTKYEMRFIAEKSSNRNEKIRVISNIINGFINND